MGAIVLGLILIGVAAGCWSSDRIYGHVWDTYRSGQQHPRLSYEQGRVGFRGVLLVMLAAGSSA